MTTREGGFPPHSAAPATRSEDPGRCLTSMDVVAHAPGPLATQLDGEIIALNVERGNYYAMGVTGSRIWELTIEPTSVENVVRDLCAEFDVDADVCRREVVAFAEELRREDLLTVVT